MEHPSIIIVELIGGRYDGTTYIADDPSRRVRLIGSDESDIAIAAYRETNGGIVGAIFTVSGSLEPPPKYGHHRRIIVGGESQIVEVRPMSWVHHKYQVTGVLAEDSEVYIRAAHVDASLNRLTMTTGKLPSLVD